MAALHGGIGGNYFSADDGIFGRRSCTVTILTESNRNKISFSKTGVAVSANWAAAPVFLCAEIR